MDVTSWSCIRKVPMQWLAPMKKRVMDGNDAFTELPLMKLQFGVNRTAGRIHDHRASKDD